MPPRRPLRSVPVVIVHGWRGSEPEHWQSWLAAQLRDAGREVRYPDLPDVETPSLDAWLSALDATLAGLPEEGFDVVAHSLGAVLLLHHVAADSDAPRPARVALVAPPSPATRIPEIVGFFPPPLDIDLVRHAGGGTVLVGGEGDPYTPEGIGAAYGLPLKIATTVIPGGAHLNVDAGYGPWPAVLSWCNRDNLAFY
jgi:predicted alpha/beta hydrolase family esterase